MTSYQEETGLTLAARYLVPFVLLLFLYWRAQVNGIVPEPYLDEVFHIRQAQTYWAHNWTQWDPKITTPPGLYLWSYILCAGLLLLRGSPQEVGPIELRATNLVAAGLVLPWRLQALLDLLRKEKNTRPSGASLSHTVLNICLFPPLFFFSALYYTDILALLVVVEAYIWDIDRSSRSSAGSKTWMSALREQASFANIVFIFFGLAALGFRQTNIFWVAVFLGGLQAVRVLRQNSKACKSSDIPAIFERGLNGELYDPLIEDANLGDFFKTAASLFITILYNLPVIVVSVLPHLLILAAFSAFVLWNGGVVLGHKEFHTAGLHLPQMLYIWPYFVFFSWPLLLLPVINIILPARFVPSFFQYGLGNKKRLPGLLALLITIPLMLATVHFNTIVHPFTLADNRHYVFYVFRILLRYHWAVKYLAVLAYAACAWVVFAAFGFSTSSTRAQVVEVESTANASENWQQRAAVEKVKPKEEKKKAKSKNKKISKQTAATPVKQQLVTPENIAQIQAYIARRQEQQEAQQVRVSFVLIWVLSTALSLITAPLVEPRYFIIPWVMWRLHIPSLPSPTKYRQRRPQGGFEIVKARFFGDLSQFLETLWFLAVNAITGYVFLYKGFEWPQEPGKTQRFMW